MGPKMRKRVTQLAVGGLAALALALSTGAQATFVAYSGSGSDVSFDAHASKPINLGSVLSDLLIQNTLGISVSSEGGTTVSAAPGFGGLQVVQGCLLAVCTEADWFTLVTPGLAIGGTSIAAPAGSFTEDFDSGTIHVTESVWSVRALYQAGFSPEATTGMSGTLTVTAVPEPGTWAMMLAGVLGIGAIARRRLS